MIGNISKHAWAHGLHRYLQKTMQQPLPSFKKPWEHAYFNWLELDRICQASCIEELEGLTGNTFQSNALASLCPACFYRSDKDVLPCVFSIDGNFQHSRRKWISADRESVPYKRELFISDDYAQVNLDSSILENNGGCNHAFVAASMETKPKSMTNLDETGVMGSVCRHDIPLRYLNLFTGERSSSTIALIKSVVEQCPINTPIHVQYDIACKFQRSLQFGDPTLHKRIQLSLNAFHNYSHELRCQLQWGPLRTKGLGKSDGEGCERHWASMAHLVSVGRQSSAKSRLMLLDQHGLYQAGQLRINLVSTIQKRIAKSEKELRDTSQVLEDLVALSQQQDGTISRDFVEMELRKEAEAQRSWFMANSEAYDEHVSCYQFKEVFQHVKREKELEAELYETLNRFTLVQPESAERWKRVISILEDQCAQAVYATDEVLQRFNQCRADWMIDGHLWISYSSLETWSRLEKLKLSIHRQVSARVIELKSIRNRIRGHKGAQKLLQSLKRRLPRIGDKVDEYNKLCATLPEHCRPPPINKDTFGLEALEQTGNLPLWEFESCRANLLGNRQAWRYSATMIASVEALYRQDRAREELLYLKKELGRTLDWAETQLSSLLTALPHLTNADFQSRSMNFIIDLLEMCKGVNASDKDTIYGRSLMTLRSVIPLHLLRTGWLIVIELISHSLLLLPQPSQIKSIKHINNKEDNNDSNNEDYYDDNNEDGNESNNEGNGNSYNKSNNEDGNHSNNEDDSDDSSGNDNSSDNDNSNDDENGSKNGNSSDNDNNNDKNTNDDYNYDNDEDENDDDDDSQIEDIISAAEELR